MVESSAGRAFAAFVLCAVGQELWRGVRDDWNDEQRRDRAMRRRMRDLVEHPPRP